MKYIQQIHQQKHSTVTMWMLFCFGIIFARLLYLQIIHHQTFSQIGQKNFVRFKTIPAQRGSILDCHGKPLATNQPVTNLVWHGTGCKELTAMQLQLLDKINTILDVHILPRTVRHAEKFSKTITLAENISQQQLCLIAEQCSDSDNITFDTMFERIYPFGNSASHILGYLSDTQMLSGGKMGLEKILEDALKGESGVMLQYINSFGTLLDAKPIRNQASGKDIVTTIDMRVQKIAEQAMKQHQSGAFILLDPETGQIPALVSLPNFDPKLFSQKISAEQWNELQRKKSFVNRAFNASYPPASIFKLVTIAAALEEGIISPDSTFNCKGHVIFKKRKYFCNRHAGHGEITLKECLAHSCNIPCYEIGKKIPIDTLANYAFMLGLGQKTDVAFTEQYGLVPTNDWKKMVKGERWWTGETLSASIGQSFLLTTPIQIACMVGAIFQGYLVKPQIIQDADPVKTEIDISEATKEFLQDCMKSVITFGTGRRMNKLGDITIFAKTGTAQTIGRSKRNRSDADHLEHAWFVSYFYTEQSKPLVLVVLLEHVGGARHATNVAKEFLMNYSKIA